MKIRLNEDYYFWCCDWCDSENLVLWAKLESETNCGACHRPMNLPDKNDVVIDSTIAAGLRQHVCVVDIPGLMVPSAGTGWI